MSAIDKFGRQLANDGAPATGLRGLPGKDGKDGRPGVGFTTDKDGNFSAGSKQFKNVRDPEDKQDAVTKGWVEDRIQALRLDCETLASGSHESLEGKIKIVESEIVHIKKLLEATAAKGTNTGTPSNRPVTSSTKKP